MPLLVQLVGAALVLTAFALLQVRRLSATSVVYLALNAVGPAALAADAVVDRNWGFVALNAVWCAVSLASLVRRGFRRPEMIDNRG